MSRPWTKLSSPGNGEYTSRTQRVLFFVLAPAAELESKSLEMDPQPIKGEQTMRFFEKNSRFDYGHARLSDVKTYGFRSTSTGRVTITGIEIHGKMFAPSLCFWRSFFNHFGISPDVLRLYGPSEVFERVQQREADAPLHYCVEHDTEGNSTIMVVCARMSLAAPSDN